MRLLIAEDNAGDRDLVVLELARAGIRSTQTHVENKQQFERAMVPGAFDAIISDYRFPSWTGMDAFAFAQGVDAEVPFLLVTGNLGDEAAVDCIKRGVSDYILKDHLFRLPVALERAIADRALRQKHFHAQEVCAFPKFAIGNWCSTRFMEFCARRPMAFASGVHQRIFTGK